MGNVMRRRVLHSFAFPIMFVTAAAGGVQWWDQERFIEDTDNAYIEGDISVISPRIEGYVSEVMVADNQAVSAGDIVAKIDDRDFIERLAERRAAHAAAQASVATIDHKVLYQRSVVAEMRATLDAARAECDRAAAAHERHKALAQEGIVGIEDVETTRAQRLIAEAEISRIMAVIAAEEQELHVLATSRIEAEARVAEASARLQLAESDLEKTIIRAPIAGIVGNRSLRVGQFVKPGTELLSVVPNAVYVVANFKETQLELIKTGQTVEILVDAFPGKVIRGEVESFAPASGAMFSLLPAENATGNFTKIVQRVPVRIAVPADNDLQGLLRPGLSVQVSIDTRNASYKGITEETVQWLISSASAGEVN